MVGPGAERLFVTREPSKIFSYTPNAVEILYQIFKINITSLKPLLLLKARNKQLWKSNIQLTSQNKTKSTNTKGRTIILTIALLQHCSTVLIYKYALGYIL